MDALSSVRVAMDPGLVVKPTRQPVGENRQTKLQRLMDRLTTLVVKEYAHQGKRVAKRQAEDEVLAYLDKKREKKPKDRISVSEIRSRPKNDPVIQYSKGFAHSRNLVASFVSSCATRQKRACVRLVDHLNHYLQQVPMFAKEQQGKYSCQHRRQKADDLSVSVAKSPLTPLTRLFSVLSIIEHPSKYGLQKKDRKRKEFKRKRAEWAWMETVTDVSTFS